MGGRVKGHNPSPPPPTKPGLKDNPPLYKRLKKMFSILCIKDTNTSHWGGGALSEGVNSQFIVLWSKNNSLQKNFHLPDQNSLYIPERIAKNEFEDSKIFVHCVLKRPRGRTGLRAGVRIRPQGRKSIFSHILLIFNFLLWSTKAFNNYMKNEQNSKFLALRCN